MPKRAKKPCRYPGCPELVEGGKTYCEKHEKVRQEREKKRHQFYDRLKRDRRKAKFYGSAVWKRVRDAKLKADPLCEYCQEEGRITPATEVDHIIPIEVRWDLRLAWENLKSSCHACHMKKTAEDRREYGGE